MLSKDRYLSSFTTDASTLLDHAASSPGAAVVHCDDWTVDDLVAHVGGVWAFMYRQVATRSTERIAELEPLELEGAALIDGSRRIAAELSEVLAEVDVDDVVWSWTSDHTGGFYLRRAAQETAVHLWDVLCALDRVEPLADDIARDGIDELVDVTYPNLLERGVAEPTGSLHLHCTEGEGEWSMRVVDGRVSVSRSHDKGDAAIRGAASDLDLALWERVALDSEALDVFGDVEVAASWTALSR